MLIALFHVGAILLFCAHGYGKLISNCRKCGQSLAANVEFTAANVEFTAATVASLSSTCIAPTPTQHVSAIVFPHLDAETGVTYDRLYASYYPVESSCSMGIA